jgi:hypothetical protein
MEPLIYSGQSRWEPEMCRFKAQFAANSRSIGKSCNAEAVPVSSKMRVYE